MIEYKYDWIQVCRISTKRYIFLYDNLKKFMVVKRLLFKKKIFYDNDIAMLIHPLLQFFLSTIIFILRVCTTMSFGP